MAQKVPPMEETKKIILAAKGEQWLKQQQAAFVQKYGTTVKDPAMVFWLIGKQAGLEVEDIKASAGSDEGESVLIAEIIEKAKTPETQGWTYMKSVGAGVEFIKPASADKYSLTAVILAWEEGTTSKGGPKLDLVIADGSGVSKLVAYADAVNLFVEAKARIGSVVKLPHCNVQYGFHNFGSVKNQVWWKFSVPPFGEVQVLDSDPKDFFLKMEVDAVKENRAAVLTGFITFVEEREQAVCNVCDQWVMEKKPHVKCQEKENYDPQDEIFYFGTATSINGETKKLKFASKPKVKVAVDLLEVFGKMNKNSTLEVAFIRKAGTSTVEVVPAPAAPAKPAPKAKPKPAVTEEQEDGEEPEPEPTPAPKATPKLVKRTQPADASAIIAADRKALDATQANGAAQRKAALKAFQEQQAAEEAAEANASPEGEETEQPEVPEPVIVRKAAKSPPASPAVAKKVVQVAASGAESELGIEIPADVAEVFERIRKQFGGTSRVFVMARNLTSANLLEGADPEADKALVTCYVEEMVRQGNVQWTSKETGAFKWVS